MALSKCKNMSEADQLEKEAKQNTVEISIQFSLAIEFEELRNKKNSLSNVNSNLFLLELRVIVYDHKSLTLIMERQLNNVNRSVLNLSMANGSQCLDCGTLYKC
ncbi:CLUMA_CG002722, isoform A [Clunio marinus]|uniref:CLUMA_CG002722, isoform A n=1 Tax=Clunio marinus TaxID=568069 RepID=A0A1J1HLS7_9DIPT|nr:CLUMA_CG002722, isoform A [Clunio marinus]